VSLPPHLLAIAAAPNQTLAIVLLCGFGLLTFGLLVLMWTRWGQAQPLAKCVGLSVLAHLLLLIYAYATQVFYDVPGNPDSEVFEVRLVHTDDDVDASPWVDPNALVLSPDDLDLMALGAPGEDDHQAPGAQPESAEPAEPSNSAPPLLAAPPPVEPANENVADASPPEQDSSEVPELEPSPTEIARDETPSAPLPADEITPPEFADLAPAEESATPPEPPSFARQEMPEPPPFPAPQAEAGTVPVIAPSVAEGGASTAAPLRRMGDGKELPKIYAARIAADRLKVAEQHGGDANTEAAVAGALEWLAANQSPDGRWDADKYGAGRETMLLGHDRGGAGAKGDTGITGLALLAMLGAGNTHLEGNYRENVQHGLEFLLRSQAANGSLQGEAELFASMYCHGIATLALCEAYAMTGDPRLRNGVTRAIRYTLDAQHVTGGWRYQPGDAGDMSQFGWQVMALKSAEIGGLPIPHETRVRMTRFLRSVTSGRRGGLASYRPGERPSRTMTAEALVCRSLAGIENSFAAMDEGGQFIMSELPGSGRTDFYYYYYATLAMYQRQGSDWDRWNKALQNKLLRDQRRDDEFAGSWDPDAMWGSYGGRVYSTALGALCLEVYYRYLPLYDNDFTGEPRWTERPGWPLPR